MRSVISLALCAVAGPGLQVGFEATPDADNCSHATPLQPTLLPEPAAPLNPRFSFETFLAADFNRLALTAAQDISAESSSYSPLFITGPAGSGKTHLLHAIGRAASARGIRFLLINAEQFLSEFTTAVRNQHGAAFRARYRSLDLLLIDDIHVLLGKKATLNEFYVTLAGMHDEGRRIAVAGDPSAMTSEGARFRGLLRWGLVAEIQPPSLEDRILFVATRAYYQGVQLPEEVQHYIALRVRSSVRDLEGAVNRVTALARISHEPLDIDFAAKALQPVSLAPAIEPPVIPASSLIDAVCRHLDLCREDVASQKRDRSLTYARHLAMYLLRQQGGLSYSAIAYLLGKKDHSTVVHACAQVHKELQRSPSLRADVDAVLATFLDSGHAA
jgi:chromosomal replication initiator protein